MFTMELRRVLKYFDLEEAETLSDKLHKAEENSYTLTLLEEAFWKDLTTKIVSERKSRGLRVGEAD